ncbi:nucleotidyl transferase AbiEii/AbiGii toxin family protein [Paracoccus litorisediminis]|uniref:nucleotidyl transferase AbiEii/AbiGii toxin family protein n=1 Tax=Paracoccus litorisediminis TaxID=2006130 RepID=UPI00372FB68C
MVMDFARIVDHAMQDPAVAGLRPVIEKEILHYDILFALERGGLLRDIIFQGGTSLRLCHGGSRFSEDLDFVGGYDFSSRQLDQMRDCIMDHIGTRYGLEIAVKPPKEMKFDPNYQGVNTDRWQIAIVTSPERPDLPKQRIKLEVANVPAYTSELMSPLRNYDAIPHGYTDVLIPTETIDEIMADKIISLAACHERVRNRDIWDLAWLRQHKGEIIPDLIEQKIRDYRIENYEDKLAARIANLPAAIQGVEFRAEMARFIAPEAQKTSLARPGFLPFLTRQVTGIMKDAEKALYHREELAFMM